MKIFALVVSIIGLILLYVDFFEFYTNKFFPVLGFIFIGSSLIYLIIKTRKQESDKLIM
jgi:hypothetical protein